MTGCPMQLVPIHNNYFLTTTATVARKATSAKILKKKTSHDYKLASEEENPLAGRRRDQGRSGFSSRGGGKSRIRQGMW
jgi:hypothetical protein